MPTPANFNYLFQNSFTIEPADLRKSIFTLAVRGKIVPQIPTDEPAGLLLQKIADEKQKLVAGKPPKQGAVAPITAGEIPFAVPPDWHWARLSSVTKRIHYGFTASAKSEIKNVRLLRITDIQNNSVDWTTVPGCEISEQEIPQYRLEKGDILVARTGGTVGKTYLVRDLPVIAVFASYLIRIQEFRLFSIDI